ncbi:Frag1/DRAM/Sfk1 family-domain-containing protein [Dipodascopsis tothii]|uniref:Frag1/DRAM/Sfk1 family-domain-containing protein n=1 Tax=Dipodascopsis tothii TaxID=44089 RepID=UPI0034CF3E52
MEHRQSAASALLARIEHYWLMPVACLVVWWSMLIAMLAVWAGQGRPKYVYEGEDAAVPYISDIAASAGMQVLFITGDAVQGLFFILTLWAERYLRHNGRLEYHFRQRENTISAMAIAFGMIGQLGLVLVAVCRVDRYKAAHYYSVGVFVAGVGLAAACSSVEFTWLRQSYPEVRWLRRSYKLKLVWFTIAFVLATVFLFNTFTNNADVGASVEWILAFWYGAFIIILAVDLYPAAKAVDRFDDKDGRLDCVEAVPEKARPRGYPFREPTLSYNLDGSTCFDICE